MESILKFEDSIILGMVAGFIANIPKTIVTELFQQADWVHYTFKEIAAGFFVKKTVIENPIALTVSYLEDFTLAGVLGLILVYILRKTGKDYAIIKGLEVGAVAYMLLYGMTMALDLTRVNLRTPLPSHLLFISHLLFGTTDAWAVKRYDGVE